MTISYAASANVTKYGKINLSRSANVKKKVRKDGYIFLAIGLILLIVGFRDKFVQGDKKGESHFKKCTPFNEGFSACRKFDRQSVWVILKETDGSEVAKIEFPDSLKVVGLGLFKEGRAEVVGEKKKGKKNTVGFIDTSGSFSPSNEITPQIKE